MTVTEVPELVPARMLNEYAYCPRLFFLEWVDQLWAPSSDTAEGDRQHRRVDAGGGAAPLPSEGAVKAARSVELPSERLGIIAQIDLLEGLNGSVVPVDTKKGRPARDSGPWEADAVQVCAQVLLLREHGYTAEHGEIFYAETRQRVPVEVTPDLVARTKAAGLLSVLVSAGASAPNRAALLRHPGVTGSLFEHPEAELSADDSAQLGGDRRQPDHIARLPTWFSTRG